MKKMVKIDDELTMSLNAFILKDCVQAQYDVFKNDGSHVSPDEADKVYFAKIAMREVNKAVEAGELK